ncbi:hypothetical protein ACQSH3_09600 [Klebsiella pneumoniae]|uniref:hypothetical protein n=1 Tax=Klebsiella pneumoniae complex TaxID=3390273 RepID=UPI0022AF0E71|nr:hypothetical protein [Klebsiella variicola]EIX9701415.1 hypothetical protein [Klebsiella pneumoniae]EIY5129712.1 hypothetical protein [Klebsiella variicola]EJM8711811.1 hypothetical protein [Klebsiella pneumoniae]MCZ3534604.1 hypothetical protein [Klebsiella variicola]HCB0368436.1 hypothetical protein [Klebsiella pneumoniae]
MNEQEQLQRLSEEIAGAYLRHLKETTGGNTVTYDGVTKAVIFEELVFGLIGVAHTNARKHPEDQILKDPHKHLSQMINLFARPYKLTDFGLRVIEMMNEKSIHKERGVSM